MKLKARIIEKTKSPFVSKKQIQETVLFFKKELLLEGIEKEKLNKKELLIVFTSSEEMKQLNKNYLNKNRATDVLSFSPVVEESLGELILSIEKIKTQAIEHKLSLQEEMMYLILHGLLHLLGYHHEKGGKMAKKMYHIQDNIFEKWQKQVFKKRKS